MKRIVLLSAIITGLLLTSACGASAPLPSPTAAAALPSPTTSSSQETSSSGGTEVNVTLADNTIQSSQTTFQAGVPYTFIVVNMGRHAHNFNIAPPVSLAGSLDAALAKALLSIDRGKLQVGETATAEYTFPATAVDQKLEFSCLIPMHYEDGMLLAITVTK